MDEWLVGRASAVALDVKDELCREVISTSKPIKDVAEAYGVGPETVRNWLIKYRDANGNPGRPIFAMPHLHK